MERAAVSGGAGRVGRSDERASERVRHRGGGKEEGGRGPTFLLAVEQRLPDAVVVGGGWAEEVADDEGEGEAVLGLERAELAEEGREGGRPGGRAEGEATWGGIRQPTRHPGGRAEGGRTLWTSSGWEGARRGGGGGGGGGVAGIEP